MFVNISVEYGRMKYTRPWRRTKYQLERELYIPISIKVASEKNDA